MHAYTFQPSHNSNNNFSRHWHSGNFQRLLFSFKLFCTYVGGAYIQYFIRIQTLLIILDKIWTKIYNKRNCWMAGGSVSFIYRHRYKICRFKKQTNQISYWYFNDSTLHYYFRLFAFPFCWNQFKNKFNELFDGFLFWIWSNPHVMCACFDSINYGKITHWNTRR